MLTYGEHARQYLLAENGSRPLNHYLVISFFLSPSLFPSLTRSILLSLPFSLYPSLSIPLALLYLSLSLCVHASVSADFICQSDSNTSAPVRRSPPRNLFRERELLGPLPCTSPTPSTHSTLLPHPHFAAHNGPPPRPPTHPPPSAHQHSPSPRTIYTHTRTTAADLHMFYFTF